MRIAIVETAPHGGLLHYAVQLGDGLASRGHDVDLITTQHNELAARGAGRARMRPVLLPTVRSTGEPPTGLAYKARRALVALRLAGAWARVIYELRRGRYDAAIVNADLTLSLAVAACLLLSMVPGRPPLANVCHNVRPYNRSSGDDLFSSSPLLLRLLGRLYPRFDLVFVHGEKSRKEFEETWPPVRLAEIPHGDERLFGGEPPPPSDEERVLFFGDWRKVKGLHVLMDAFDELITRRPAARLTIAGTPSAADLDPDKVRDWARAHGDRVTVVDQYVPVEEVPAIFGAARVVATPYVVGYQSGVIHLAMTMARAVVTSDVGDLGTAVTHGETGLVVAPGDARPLAAALEELLDDPDRANRMGEAGRRKMMSGASWEAVAEKVEAALR